MPKNDSNRKRKYSSSDESDSENTSSSAEHTEHVSGDSTDEEYWKNKETAPGSESEGEDTTKAEGDEIPEDPFNNPPKGTVFSNTHGRPPIKPLNPLAFPLSEDGKPLSTKPMFDTSKEQISISPAAIFQRLGVYPSNWITNTGTVFCDPPKNYSPRFQPFPNRSDEEPDSPSRGRTNNSPNTKTNTTIDPSNSATPSPRSPSN